MVPQYYPWLFDDRDAWEKAIADPRYSYDLPIDYFMSIYQQYRTGANAAMSAAAPVFFSSAPMPAYFPSSTIPASFSAPSSTLTENNLSQNAQLEEKSDDSILSQSEIDALLAGLQ